MVKTITVKEKTHDRLTKIGKKGETYEDIIIRLLNEHEGD